MNAIATAVLERPILMSAPMVRAILDGRKTQTRLPSAMRGADRVFWHRGETHSWGNKPPQQYEGWVAEVDELSGLLLPLSCPYGQAGDRLWVRETWHCPKQLDGSYHREKLIYAADRHRGVRWQPSVQMPRWASRLTLEITGVRVERVQQIAESDIYAEGAKPIPSCQRHWFVPGYDFEEGSPRAVYSQLWDELHAHPGFTWESNPLVWVIEFRRVR